MFRVLLVEDKRVLLRHLSFCIASAGWDCRTASDAEVALLLVRAWRPSVAVVDLEIPASEGDYADESAGWQLLETLGELKSSGDIVTAVVVLSAFKKPADVTPDQAGAVGTWLTKPVTCDDLRSAICDVVAPSPGRA